MPCADETFFFLIVSTGTASTKPTQICCWKDVAKRSGVVEQELPGLMLVPQTEGLRQSRGSLDWSRVWCYVYYHIVPRSTGTLTASLPTGTHIRHRRGKRGRKLAILNRAHLVSLEYKNMFVYACIIWEVCKALSFACLVFVVTRPICMLISTHYDL